VEAVVVLTVRQTLFQGAPVPVLQLLPEQEGAAFGEKTV
jgi:hypothetical protein